MTKKLTKEEMEEPLRKSKLDKDFIKQIMDDVLPRPDEEYDLNDLYDREHYVRLLLSHIAVVEYENEDLKRQIRFYENKLTKEDLK